MDVFEVKEGAWKNFLEKFKEAVDSYNYCVNSGSESTAIGKYQLLEGLGSSVYYLFGIERNVTMRESDGLITKVVFKSENKIIAEIKG